MADVKKLKIGSTSYDIVDAGARELISELEAYSEYLGVTTTELTDGASTNPIVINGESVTAKKGEIVNYGSKEFIFNGSVWQEFGDLSALGELAYEDTAEGSYTPAGSVSQATFTGSSLTSTGSFTPEGSVAAPTFTGSEMTSTGSFTPEGSVSKPDVDVTPTTAAVVGVTATNVPTNAEYDSTTETITFTVGSAATLASSVNVLTGVTAALHETPAFTGTAGSVSVTGTPAGTNSAPAFTGTAGSVSVSGTPEGTISEQTFTGTAATITVGAPE